MVFFSVLAFFLTLYLALSYYLYRDLARLLRPTGSWRITLVVAMVLMTAGIFSVRLISRAGYPAVGGFLGSFFFTWMTTVGWYALASGLIRLWSFAAGLLAHYWPAAHHAVPGQGLYFGLSFVTVAVSAVLGLMEAQRINLVEVRIKVAHLPPGTPPIRILQLTDLHLGGGTSEARFRRVMELARSAGADLIVSTGDIIDQPADLLSWAAVELASLEAPLGKIAIPGNHEYYAGWGNAESFHRQANFTLLRGEMIEISPTLRLATADDPAGGELGHDGGLVRPELPEPKPGMATILLRHRPKVDHTQLGRFDFQISGHTHGGQVFPFTLAVRLFYKYDREFFELGRGSRLYVSRGAGTWGPPMRLLAPPEVTVYVLEP